MATQFLVDTNGRRTAVVVPLQDFLALVKRLEELEDLRLVEERKNEPSIPVSSLEDLLADVEADGYRKDIYRQLKET